MNLAELDARDERTERHDVQRTAHLMLAIDTLTEAWNGCFDDDDFLIALRRTAERLCTLADATEQNRSPTPTTIALRKQCPRCDTTTEENECPQCDYHFGNGING